MKYEPVRALKVFEAVLRGQGLDPATVALQTAARARVADLVNEALAAAWRHALWPQIMDVKRIRYREEWSEETAYDAGAECYRRNAAGVPVYYRARVQNLGVEPGTDDAVWEVPADFVPGFYYCQHYVDEIDLEAGLYAENPDLRLDPRPYTLKATHYGACVADLSGEYPAEPWIRYRPMPPEFSWTDWAAGTEYAAGETAFYGSNSWQCLAEDTGTTPGTDAAVWAETPFPKMFLPYAVAWTAAARMQDDDGRAAQFARADRILEELEERHVQQIRARKRARVRVC